MDKLNFINQFSKTHIIANYCFTVNQVVKDFEKQGSNKKSSKYDYIFHTENLSEYPALDEYLYQVASTIKAEKSSIVLAFIFVDKLCNCNQKLFKKQNLHK